MEMTLMADAEMKNTDTNNCENLEQNNSDTEADVFANRPKANSFLNQLKRSFAITKKDLRIYYNKGPVVIQGILFPIVLFVAFTLGRDIENHHIISGLITMVLFLTATSIGPVVFPWETRQKTLERLLTCPISVRTILMGNIWSSSSFGGLFALFPLIIGASIFHFWTTMKLWIILPGIILGALAFSCFSLILSVPPTNTPADTMMLTILVKFPLIFVSPLFMAIKPETIYVYFSPLTYFVDIINTGFSGVSAFGTYGLLLDFGVLFLFGLFFLLLSFFLHSKTVQKRF
jgi:ABC-2 type transport system permease protein